MDYFSQVPLVFHGTGAFDLHLASQRKQDLRKLMLLRIRRVYQSSQTKNIRDETSQNQAISRIRELNLHIHVLLLQDLCHQISGGKYRHTP